MTCVVVACSFHWERERLISLSQVVFELFPQLPFSESLLTVGEKLVARLLFVFFQKLLQCA